MNRPHSKKRETTESHDTEDSALFERHGNGRGDIPVRGGRVDMADVDAAVAVLRRGGVILYPTDTVWGIGCDATNDEAVRRVYAIKQRDDSKAMLTLVSDLAMLERTVDGIPDVAYDLIEFSDRPTTIVYDKGIGVSPLLLGPDGTLGVRVAGESFCNALVRRLGRPLVSSSANISGKPAARSFDEIAPEVADAADYICTSRRDDPCLTPPSCVIRLTASGQFTILRK